MEVLHTYNGSYPFGKRKDSNHTFVELIKENLTEQDIHLYKQMTKIYKNINSPYFIRLNKMLRQDDKLYFIYQYEEISITAYVEAVRRSIEGTFSRDKYKCLLIEFKNNIDVIIDVLVKQEIKADIVLRNLACVKKQDSQNGFMLKTFIDMEAEYLSLIDHNYRPKESKKKDRSSLNQEFLLEFYDAQRKRLMLDFEELVENIFESLEASNDKKQFPNFVIQGTKLVFVQPEEKLKDNSYENIGDGKKNQYKDKQGNKVVDNDKKLGEVKQQMSGELKTKQRAPKLSYQEEQNQQEKKNHPQTPIIDFDQSFEPEFRPQEFTKEKTYIYEEDDYLESLEEQIEKMHQQKKVPVEQKKINNSSEQKRHNFNTSAEEKKLSLDRQRKESKQTSPMTQYSQKITKQSESIKQKDQISQGSTQSNPNNNSNHSNHSNSKSKDNISNDSYDRKQGGKMNKYKMKIITSHQIEIQGGEEPNVEQIQKQIMEGIRTGKININELNNKQKFTVLQKNQVENQPQRPIQQMCKSDHREQRNSFDTQKMVNSDHKPVEQVKQPFVKTKEIPINKMKNVHQIIQKLGIKPKNSKEGQPIDQIPKNQQHTKAEQPSRAEYVPKVEKTEQKTEQPRVEYTPQPSRTEYPLKVEQPLRVEPKKQISFLQSATTPKPEKQKPEQSDKSEKNTYPQKPTFKQKDSPIKNQIKNEDRPSGYQQKVDPIDTNQKNQKTQKYFTKIQQAKSKAEQILREYARKKN